MWGKGRFVDKNHGLTPLQNVHSLEFLRTSLFRSKKLYFLSRISKIVSFFLFCRKKILQEKGRFLQKNHWLTPLQNVDFLEIFRTFLFWSKKHSVLSRISKNVFFSLFLLRKKIWGKGRFFDKNHRLTPLQNADFFRLCENFTFVVQKTLFSIQNIKKCFFLPFLLIKNMIRIRSIFRQKPWTNPFAKCPFFWLC